MVASAAFAGRRARLADVPMEKAAAAAAVAAGLGKIPAVSVTKSLIDLRALRGAADAQMIHPQARKQAG